MLSSCFSAVRLSVPGLYCEPRVTSHFFDLPRVNITDIWIDQVWKLADSKAVSALDIVLVSYAFYVYFVDLFTNRVNNRTYISWKIYPCLFFPQILPMPQRFDFRLIVFVANAFVIVW